MGSFFAAIKALVEIWNMIKGLIAGIAAYFYNRTIKKIDDTSAKAGSDLPLADRENAGKELQDEINKHT